MAEERTPSRRVLHVMRMTGVAGSENHLRVLLPHLRSHGWESDVLIPAPRPDALREFASTLATDQCKVTVVPMRGHLSPRLIVTLARLLRSGRYAVVHAHLLHADWHLAIAGLAAPEVPIVSTKHGRDPFRRSLPVRVLDRAMARRYAALIAISDSLREFTLRWTRPTCPVVTVQYGLEPPAGGRPHRIEAETPTVLAVARLIGWKRLDVLIRAMEPITAAVPGARLLIAGGGPERESLERLVEARGLTGSVSLLGRRGDVRELMSSAWLLGHPAESEGFGLVLLEAMSAGLPIVAARAGAIPEVVLDGVTGTLVTPGDPSELADAVIRMLRDVDWRRRAADAGFNRLIVEFSPERMARETAQVYAAAGS